MPDSHSEARSRGLVDVHLLRAVSSRTRLLLARICGLEVRGKIIKLIVLDHQLGPYLEIKLSVGGGGRGGEIKC